MNLYQFLTLTICAFINFSHIAAESKINIMVNQRSAKLLEIMSKVSSKENIKRELSEAEKNDAKNLINSSPINLNLQDKNGKTFLMYSIMGSNTSDLTDFLLNRGVNVNLQDTLGYTALMYSLLFSKYDITTKLIHKGAYLSVKGKPNKEDTFKKLNEAKIENEKRLNNCKNIPSQIAKLEEAIKALK